MKKKRRDYANQRRVTTLRNCRIVGQRKAQQDGQASGCKQRQASRNHRVLLFLPFVSAGSRSRRRRTYTSKWPVTVLENHERKKK